MRKKRLGPSWCPITRVFGATNPTKRVMRHNTRFLKIYYYVFVRVILCPSHSWKYLSMRINVTLMPMCCVSFLLYFNGSTNKRIPAMVPKTTNLHMLPIFASTTTMFTSLDLWMSKGGVNTFTLVINYLNEIGILVHVTISLFEIHETIGLYVARQL